MECFANVRANTNVVHQPRFQSRNEKNKKRQKNTDYAELAEKAGKELAQIDSDALQTCQHCFAHNNGKDQVNWVGCDKCLLWYHTDCIAKAQKERSVKWDKENLTCATCVEAGL